MYYNPSPKYEIATPERFSVQARNDKSIDCFAPRNDNEDNRKLEGVYNVMRLYRGFTKVYLPI